MSYTPSSSTVAQRGRIPTPSRMVGSGIPTPGRSRASSSATATASNGGYGYSGLEDSPGMAKAFTEAIKANDPRLHRMPSGGRVSDQGSSPHSSPTSQNGGNGLPLGQSGRKSVSRPSNITTTMGMSGTSSGPSSARMPPPKTPLSSAGRMSTAGFTPRVPSTSTNASSRPESRQSITRGKEKDRSFEPGDPVRIESLGMEGTLRYLGSIDGKPGLWAGVELNPGFIGRGKNDGTVNGVSYFSCAPKGGVFVAYAKLSAPIPRPSSVASSRGGRATPSIPSYSGRVTPAMSTGGRVTPAFSASGRVTPAYSAGSGRVTPARSVSGRVTPSTYQTPNVRSRYSMASSTTSSMTGVTPTAKPRKSVVPAHPEPPSFTAGSRASKYAGMTAQQLQKAKTAGATSGESSPKSASPTRMSMGGGSPFTTPKAPGRASLSIPATGGAKARQSMGGFGFGASATTGPGTPRSGRKTDMPPPPSPVSPSKRLLTSSPSMSRLNAGGLAASPSRRLTTPTSPSRRLTTPTGSEYSVGNEGGEEKSEHTVDLEARNRELQERIANLMNGKAVSVNGSSTNASVSPALPEEPAEPAEPMVSEKLLEEEKERVKTQLARIAELETQVRFNERAVKERESRLEALERNFKNKEEEMEKSKTDGESKIKELTGKLEDAEALVVSLKAAVEEVREGKKEEAQAIIGAKDKEIELLSAKVLRVVQELEDERKELGTQIDELRQAGQETIALYEEKLSEADTKRWEMEDLVRDLEEKLRKQRRSLSPASMARHASEAAQIDNETLREQVVHFERKVGQLESQIENLREQADKDEQAMRTRILKYKDNEVALRKELNEARTDVETRKRAEATGKTRLEELEEALRENDVALENARAEIEGLRAEVTNLEALQAGTAAANTAKTDEDAAKRNVEKARQDEINQLKEMLESSRVARREAQEQYEAAKQEVEAAKQRAESLEGTVHALENDKAEAERIAEDKNATLESERKNVESLKRDLDTKVAEIEQLRKSSSPSPSKKHDHHEEEVAGLKHIVQQLNKDNLEIASRIRRAESEKKHLQEENDELREAIRILEANVNDELAQLENEAAGIETSDSEVQKALRDSKTKHELELNQMRQKAHELEQKHAQVVNDLNKEVSELESLVEAKIYREDELERELERYKDKVARATRKSSKTSGESLLPPAPPSAPPPPPSNPPPKSVEPVRPAPADSGEICEICDEPGHDIFSCHLLKDDLPSASETYSTPSLAESDSSDLWCEDCESYGHIAADCPHSQDVF
ncbi:hypothetical protein M422DRAFT_44776 [Sphaerobolus stellatus SS14]|nr:hypothetical protein M422DRAFT_44776 [Sphaerobolus stellatus SS14]